MGNLVSNVIIAVVALMVGIFLGIWWQKRKCGCSKSAVNANAIKPQQEAKPELKPAVQAPNEPQK